MEFVLTMIICAYVEGKTSCMPPHRIDETYTDGYSCMLDGYKKAYDKIIELGRDDVNKFNIYINLIKFMWWHTSCFALNVSTNNHC